MLTDKMTAALDVLAWNGRVTASDGFNRRTLRALAERGYCYATGSSVDDR